MSARLESISFFVPFITAPLGAAYALGGRVENGITLLEQSVEQAASMRLVAHQSLRLAWLAWSELLADGAVDQSLRWRIGSAREGSVRAT